MSLFSIERRQTSSLYRRESVSLLHVEEADSSLYNIESVSPLDDSFLHRGESVSLLYIEEAYFFPMQKGECLSPICRGGRLFCIHHRERLSSIYVKEADSFPIQRRECPSYV